MLVGTVVLVVYVSVLQSIYLIHKHFDYYKSMWSIGHLKYVFMLTFVIGWGLLAFLYYMEWYVFIIIISLISLYNNYRKDEKFPL